jgi:superfamily I DNA/RNA helicase
MNFNEQQRAVINAIDGVYVTIAAPGSGKSTVLLERHLQMLIRGIPQRDILNLTFTNAAATELARRSGIIDAEKVFRTFHSFALELIKKEREHLPFKLGDTVIPVRGEDYQLLFDLVKQFPEIASFRTLQGKLSEWKRANVEPSQAIDEAMGKEYYYALAYHSYEDQCRLNGWLDFDSLMRETVKLLENNEGVRNRWKKKYLSVDEFQDTDSVQLRLLELLFDGGLICVGDPNQSLYEWRGAHPDVFKHVQQKFMGTKVLYLGENYRSTKKLVSYIREVLPVDNGIGSHMITNNEDGVDPVFIQYPDSDTEIRHVLSQAVRDSENSVILARTNRQLFDVQRIAASKNIKYRNLGKKDFFDQSEIKSILHLAKDVPQSSDAAKSLRDIIDTHNLYGRYRNSGDPMYSDPVENMNNLVKMAAIKGNVGEFLGWVRRVTYGRKSKKEKDLTLSTVHQFKGRQADHVFLIGSEHGKMPHQNGELAEEARIWYVACSRAAKYLQISWSGARSMFLEGKDFEVFESESQDRPKGS